MVDPAFLVMLVIILIAIVGVGIAWNVLRNAQREYEEEVASAKKRRPYALLEEAAGLYDLLAEGRVEEAVELYRRFAGVDLYSAQAAIEELRAIMQRDDLPEQKLALEAQPDPTARPSQSLEAVLARLAADQEKRQS